MTGAREVAARGHDFVGPLGIDTQRRRRHHVEGELPVPVGFTACFRRVQPVDPFRRGGPHREARRALRAGHDLEILHARLILRIPGEARRPGLAAVDGAQDADAVVAARGLIVKPAGRPPVAIDLAGADVDDVRILRIDRDRPDAEDRIAGIDVTPAPVRPAGVAPVGLAGMPGGGWLGLARFRELADPEPAARRAGEDAIGIARVHRKRDHPPGDPLIPNLSSGTQSDPGVLGAERCRSREKQGRRQAGSPQGGRHIS